MNIYELYSPWACAGLAESGRSHAECALWFSAGETDVRRLTTHVYPTQIWLHLRARPPSSFRRTPRGPLQDNSLHMFLIQQMTYEATARWEQTIRGLFPLGNSSGGCPTWFGTMIAVRRTKVE